MKKLFVLIFFTLLLNSAYAQTNRPKQMQKLETKVDFELLTFSYAQNRLLTKSATVTNLANFKQFLTSASDISFPISLSITETGELNFKNSNSQFSLIPEIGLVENIVETKTEFQYISSNNARASILLKLNKQNFEIDLSEDTVYILSIDKEKFAAFHLVSVKKQLAVCSLDEIAQEIMNRNKPYWKKRCFDAGSPELKVLN